MPKILNHIYKPLRYITLKQAILITIPTLTLISWVVLLVVIHQQYDEASIDRYIESQSRLVDTFLRANITNLKLHNYPEIKRSMATLNFGSSETYSGILDNQGEYIIANNSQAKEFYELVRSWGREYSLKKNYPGLKYEVGGTGYFVFQHPIMSAKNSKSLGTFISFVQDTIFVNQKKAVLRKLIIAGFLVFLFQTIIILLVSNKLVAPIESFVKKFLQNKEATDFSEQSSNVEEPFTKDILMMSRAIAGRLAKNEVDAAIGQLSYRIAHDIRSPLSTIMNYISVNQEDLDKEDAEMFKSSAMRCANRLNNMADDLVDYSKANKVEKKRINIKKIVDDAIREHKLSIKGREVNIEFSCPGNVLINIDEEKINRVLINMFKNASESIDGRGCINVNVEENSFDCHITIKDNGKGIPPENIKHIFESSFTHGKRGGTGLGLAYCESVIRAHGGSISVSSQLQIGTEFQIVIPMGDHI